MLFVFMSKKLNFFLKIALILIKKDFFYKKKMTEFELV